jgi:hypothetical protein
MQQEHHGCIGRASLPVEDRDAIRINAVNGGMRYAYLPGCGLSMYSGNCASAALAVFERHNLHLALRLTGTYCSTGLFAPVNSALEWPNESREVSNVTSGAQRVGLIRREAGSSSHTLATVAPFDARIL